jgi:hypothetical protein
MWRGRIGKVAAAPGVGVERAVRGYDQMTDMAEIVGNIVAQKPGEIVRPPL